MTAAPLTQVRKMRLDQSKDVELIHQSELVIQPHSINDDGMHNQKTSFDPLNIVHYLDYLVIFRNCSGLIVFFTGN